MSAVTRYASFASRHLLTACSAVCVALAMTACTTPPPAAAPAPAPSPADACKALVESLTAAIPVGQSLAELQARGLRVKTPLSFPPGSVPRPVQSSGAAVQMLIQADGGVTPGSQKTLKSVGEPQIATAMEAAALSMRFDFDDVSKFAAPVPYVATFAVCIRS
jgi:hypothetical protein